MSNDSPTDRDVAAEVDLLARAEFRLAVRGRETAWIRSVVGEEPSDAYIEISLDQLTMHGTLPTLRERIGALGELLDALAENPDRWDAISMTKIGDKHWTRAEPHPFARRPPRRRS